MFLCVIEQIAICRSGHDSYSNPSEYQQVKCRCFINEVNTILMKLPAGIPYKQR